MQRSTRSNWLIVCIGLASLAWGASHCLALCLQDDARGADDPPRAEIDEGEHPERPEAGAVDAEVDFDRSVEGITRAARLFDEVVQRYRTAPAIRDQCVVTTRSVPADDQVEPMEYEVPLIMSREGVRIKLNDIQFTAVDGTVYGESDRSPERILALDYEGALEPSLFTGQLAIFPFPQFGLCLSDQPIDELFFFTFDARIAGFRTGSDEMDRPYQEIRIESSTDGAPCTLRIDPETKLVVRFEAELRNATDGLTGMDIVTTMKPELLDAFPDEEFIPELEGRRMVDNLGQLFAPPNTEDLVGAVSPAYVFEGYADTQDVKIADGFGKVRIVTFWTFGSEAMVPVLSTLDALRTWAQQEEVPCDVIPVWCDVSVDDLGFYVSTNKITLPIWMDRGAGDAIDLFQTPSMPTTVIIGPNDVIERAWSDTEAPEDMLGRLKSAVRAALDKGL